MSETSPRGDAGDRVALREVDTHERTEAGMGSGAFAPLSQSAIQALRFASGLLAAFFAIVLVYTIQTDGSPFR
jgi:hypothetical protein